MKTITINLALLIVLSIFFSACGGTATSDANAVGTSADTTVETESPTVFPPLASGLASTELELLDGSKFTIADKKGKVLLLNIWGTWCAPCRAEMPDLIKMQNQYSDQGFEVVGLNIGDGEGTPETIKQIEDFAASMKLNYTLARMPNSGTEQFYQISKQQVVPQSLIVDREGRLRGVFVGGGPRIIAAMHSAVDKVMNEKL